MYNISKLSPESQRFVNYLMSGDRTRSLPMSIAIGKALANSVNIPSSPVENPEQFYRTTFLISLQQRLSELNELAVIDYETSLEYTRKFYLVRYNMAFPKKTIFCVNPDTAIEDFLGATSALDPEAIKVIKEQPLELTKLHNGLVQFFEESAQ